MILEDVIYPQATTFKLASINKIKKYNNDILIYPGHEESTTLLEEKKFNEYFKYN